MPFILQFAIAFGAALLIGSFAMTRGNGLMTVAITYGIFGLPFALAAGALARLLEKTPIGWAAGIVSVSMFVAALYFIAPNKQNFGAGDLIAPTLFGGIWSFLTWRQLGAG
jgi:peptidoglycan/LPS O-acetylase OafA/YrhL